MGLRYPGGTYDVLLGKNFALPWMSLSHQQPEPKTSTLSEQHMD